MIRKMVEAYNQGFREATNNLCPTREEAQIYAMERVRNVVLAEIDRAFDGMENPHADAAKVYVKAVLGEDVVFTGLTP